MIEAFDFLFSPKDYSVSIFITSWKKEEARLSTEFSLNLNKYQLY